MSSAAEKINTPMPPQLSAVTIKPQISASPISNRIFAYTIDQLTFALILWPAIVIAYLFGTNALTLPPLYQWLGLLTVTMVVNIIPTLIWGGSIGKLILDLRVVDKQTLKKPGAISILLREGPGRFLSGIFFLGYVWALLNPERETWHDRLSKTRVLLKTTSTESQEN